MRKSNNFAKNLTVGTSFGIDYTNIADLAIDAPGSIRGTITPNIGSELKGAQSERFFRDVNIITNAFVRYDNDIWFLRNFSGLLSAPRKTSN